MSPNLCPDLAYHAAIVVRSSFSPAMRRNEAEKDSDVLSRLFAGVVELVLVVYNGAGASVGNGSLSTAVFQMTKANASGDEIKYKDYTVAW